MGVRTLVHGVGINDADYKISVKEKVDGKWKILSVCPFYSRWSAMLKRCYSKKHLKQRPTYQDCYVCEEWLTFSNFKAWMENQDWKGKHQDKDLLIEDNKVYSPDNCVFIPNRVNNFFTKTGVKPDGLPVGVKLKGKRFEAVCSDCSTTSKAVYLGTYDTPEEAHLVWKSYKLKLTYSIIKEDGITDARVIEALIKRYS